MKMNRTRLDWAGFRGERNHCSHDVAANTVQRAKSDTETTGYRDLGVFEGPVFEPEGVELGCDSCDDFIVGEILEPVGFLAPG